MSPREGRNEGPRSIRSRSDHSAEQQHLGSCPPPAIARDRRARDADREQRRHGQQRRRMTPFGSMCNEVRAMQSGPSQSRCLVSRLLPLEH